MSSTEDYLDSLLNSIDKAKTDIDTTLNAKEAMQQEAIVERNKIKSDDDFVKASGIEGYTSPINSSRPHLRKMFSESEFLREFESELEINDADAFIEDFEREIDDEERYFEQTGEMSSAEATVAALLDGVEREVKQATDEVGAKQDAPMNLSTDNIYVDNLETDSFKNSESVANEEDDDNLDLAALLAGADDSEKADDIDEGKDDSEDGFDGLDIGLMDINSSIDEFEPDEHDESLTDDEPDLSSDSDITLESEGGLNIEDFIGEDGEGLEGLEGIEGLEGLDDLENLDDLDGLGEEGDSAGLESDKNSEESDASGKKKKDKKPNPLVEKFKLLLFGEPEEGDDEPLFGKKKKAEGEEKPKKEKKPKEPKPKKEKKEKPPKPPKPPKPKKEKKPKEPDKSPRIPLKLIIMNVILAAMMVVFVCLITTYLGQSYHMKKAESAFDKGDYIEAFAMTDGFEFKSEDDVLFQNKARILADMQETRTLYESFMKLGQYQFAVDELIKGVGRYKEYSAEAASYGISSLYDDIYADIAYQLEVQFHVSEDRAYQIYNSKNRRLYTVEVYKILKENGIDYEKLRWND